MHTNPAMPENLPDDAVICKTTGHWWEAVALPIWARPSQYGRTVFFYCGNCNSYRRDVFDRRANLAARSYHMSPEYREWKAEHEEEDDRRAYFRRIMLADPYVKVNVMPRERG